MTFNKNQKKATIGFIFLLIVIFLFGTPYYELIGTNVQFSYDNFFTKNAYIDYRKF